MMSFELASLLFSSTTFSFLDEFDLLSSSFFSDSSTSDFTSSIEPSELELLLSDELDELDEPLLDSSLLLFWLPSAAFSASESLFWLELDDPSLLSSS